MNKRNSKIQFNQKVIDEINKLRSDPREYALKIKRYSKFFLGNVLYFPGIDPISTSEGESAFIECADFLNNLNPIPPVNTNKNLSLISESVFNEISNFSKFEEISNMNIQSHIDKYGQIIGPFIQTIDFGSQNPELVCISLLVDDGDKRRTNRTNILNPKFRYVGVYSNSHKDFRTCCIICFCRHFLMIGDEVFNLSDDNYEGNQIKKTDLSDSLNISQKLSLAKKKDSENLLDLKKISEKVNGFIKVREENFDLPEGVVKIEISEKTLEEGSMKRKIKRTKYFNDDGTIKVEIEASHIL